MKKKLMYILLLSLLPFLYVPASFSIEVAPRISDREIVERLSRLEEGQDSLNKRLDDMRSEMNSRFDDLRSEMNSRFNAMDKRFDLLTWILGLYITISMVILGFVIKMQWQMQKRQTQMETSLTTQRDEITFLKGLIEKLLPPKGVL